MRFERLRDEVARAERRVETRVLRAHVNWRVLGTAWRKAWTPGRLLVVGLAGGFLFARARPLGKIGGLPTARLIQLASSLAGLVASLRAQGAAETAQTAAADAETAAEETTETVDAATGAAPGPSPDAAPAAEPAPASVSDARRRPEAPWTAEPRPAEAATEVSER